METALLTEHLQFTPLTLLDDIINTVNDCVARSVDAAEKGLLDAPPANLGFDSKYRRLRKTPDTDETGAPHFPDARPEIEEGLHKLETLLESNVDRNFDKFEIYVLRGVLNVPEELVPWVRLGHYEGVALPTQGGEGLPSAEEVQGMRHRLRETRKLNRVLEARVRRNDAALQKLRDLTQGHVQEMKMEHDSSSQSGREGNKDDYTFLADGEGAKTIGVSTSGSSAPDGPLATNTSFALSQLPALRALLDELRPKVAELDDAQAAATESHSARERRIYLNNQTRKAVERQGVEIDAPAQGLGRRPQGDELAGLEGVAESLSVWRKLKDGDAMEE